MAKLVLDVSAERQRFWLYFLRRKYKSKAGLKRLAELAIKQEVVAQAEAEASEAYAMLVEKKK